LTTKRLSVRSLAHEGVEQDLEAIYVYIAEFDSVDSADHVLDALLESVESLTHFHDRGAYPKELIGLGIQEYLQAFFKPYRVIYCVIGQQVLIVLIADVRRDRQALLGRRLLGS
jgi:toxin ParE1/3/4